MWITDWTARAACKGTDPDELFVQGAAQNRAKLICRGCTVRTECLADALDNRIEFGVWGGMTERERRALLRRRGVRGRGARRRRPGRRPACLVRRFGLWHRGPAGGHRGSRAPGGDQAVAAAARRRRRVHCR